MAKEIAPNAYWTLVAPTGEPLALTTTSADFEQHTVLLQFNKFSVDQRPIKAGLAIYRLSAATARNLGTALLNASRALDAIAAPEAASAERGPAL